MQIVVIATVPIVDLFWLSLGLHFDQSEQIFAFVSWAHAVTARSSRREGE